MTAIDYATLSEVEAYAGVNFSDGIGPDDTQMATIITNASRLVDTYARRQVAGTVSYTEYFDARPNMEHITLSHRPIATISSVSELDDNGVEKTWTETRNRNHDSDTEAWWLEDSSAGIIRFHGRFTRHVKQFIKVVYTAGQAAPSPEAKLATILISVRQAARAAINDENCMDRVKEMWRVLLNDSEREMKEVLELVKSNSTSGVSSYGIGGGK